MALPNYGSSKRGMPIVDQRAGAVAVPRNAEASIGDTEIAKAPELTTADRARTIVGNNRLAVLSVDVEEQSAPLGFVVPYTVSGEGLPLIGIRAGVKASGELRSGTAASLTVSETPLTSSGVNAFGGITLVGALHHVDDEDLATQLKAYGQNQPADAAYIRRGLASLYSMEVSSILVMHGDGTIDSLPVDAFEAADADPLAAIAPGLVAHLTGEQGGSLVLLCRAFGGQPRAEAAKLVGIDQYGIDMLVKTGDKRHSVRINFSHPVNSPEEVRKELAIMVRGARFKLGVG